MAGINIKGAEDLSDVLGQAIRQVGGSGNVVEDLFDKAYALRDARTKLNTQRNAVREALRNLSESGILNDDQESELNEVFPPRGSGAESEADENGTAE